MGQTLIVSTESFSPYKTIAAALKVATAGDTIDVTGQFHEALTITKNIQLKGQSATFYQPIHITADVRIDNIHFYETVTTEHGTVRFTNCTFEPKTGNALTVLTPTTLLQCQIHGGDYGVYATAPATIQNTTIHHATCGIYSQQTVMNIEHSTIIDSTKLGISTVDGELIMHHAKVLRSQQSNIKVDGTQTTLSNSAAKHSHDGAGLWALNQSVMSISHSELTHNAKPNISMAHSQLFVEKTKLTHSKQCGIWMKDQAKAQVIDCTVSDNTYANVELADSMINIENCQVNHSASDGLYVSKRSIAHITGCNFNHNTGSNVCYVNSDGHLVDCTLHDSSKNGLWVSDNSKVTMKQSKLFRNKFPAVGIEASSLDIENCEFFDGLQSAVWLKARANVTIHDCQFKHQRASHIIVEKNSHLKLSRCLLQQANQNGIWAREQATVDINDCTVKECRYPGVGGSQSTIHIKNSTIEHNTEHGVWLTEGSVATIDQCDIALNGYCNIALNDSDLTLSNSRLSDAKEYGLIVKEHSHSIVDCSTIRTSGYDNIHVARMASLQMRNSILEYAERDGLYIHSDATASVISSRFEHNQQYGIYEKKDAANVQLSTATYAENGRGDYVKEGATIQSAGPVRFKTPIATARDIVALKELDAMVGLTKIKKSLHDMVRILQFNAEAAELGFEQHTPSFASHTVLYGNPGTGKATVAVMLAKLYKELGLLEKGHVVHVNREQLVGSYIGQTAPKTQKKIDEAMGGVLFIDEAYALTNRHSAKDFGPEAIEVILEAMERHRGKFIGIAAGYPQEMQHFLKSNPGFESRFTQFFHFDDYTPEEMVHIAEQMLQQQQRFLDEQAKQALTKEFIRLWRKKDSYFANARTVRQDVTKMVTAQKLRCLDMNRAHWTPEVLATITPADVAAVVAEEQTRSFTVPIQEELLQQALNELHALVGLENVKQSITKLIDLTRYYRDEQKNVEHLTTNFVLTGNPGTGKTVVARIIAKIYEALGIVERGELVEVTRDMLVGPHVGDMERLTQQYVKRARHGVLFIDEAYQLTQYGPEDVGKRVIDTLLNYLEAYRHEMVVIVAGYPAKMTQFIQNNEGLQRRFRDWLHFPDYTPEQLLEIALHIAQESGYAYSEQAMRALSFYLMNVYEYRDDTFANAGLVRNIVQKAIHNVDYRVAKQPQQPLTKHLIDEEDLMLWESQ
ncbi:right-handed parallel beta-helix repeat-containing protein [Kurthia huakuii]|uniref:right-handed parallel beta-helix repeat-containing protein n=1 Tax=Kurthia huakuii TaxID=1421019 RepID=UPI0004950070|nr:right-handed parallel beta-helix repeat-containing protein [Kurthia huakuii]MBM7699212.1 SpoVK/Ycf46/Vps4 family AAA+-type ATPase [Kurthia huakuii]